MSWSLRSSLPRGSGEDAARCLRLRVLLVPTVLVACLAACSGGPPPPVHPGLREEPEKSPVVLVPGLTGVTLEHRETGRVLWGRGWNLLFPRDRGHNLALPLDAPGPDGFVTSDLVAGEAIRSVSLLGLRVAIYEPIFRLMEAQGYVTGDLDRPRPEDTFLAFDYDWRQDKIANARLLLERLENLRRVRGEGRLSVVLVCQSCGAHLCRWLAKYGGATLEAAEAGAPGPPASVDVTDLVLIGSSNGGSLRILREMHRGRKYLPLGRKLQPEVLFSFRSLFQDLPAYRTEYFVDGDGHPLDLDLYDAETWREYGWSVFQSRVRRRLARTARPEAIGTEEERFAYLARQLDRARRFQRLLKMDAPGFGGTRYHSIQGVENPTPDRALVEPETGKRTERNGGWRLLFPGDKELKHRPAVASLLAVPGDQHATVASQSWLSTQEIEALAGEPLYASGGHFELLLDPRTAERLLEILLGGQPANQDQTTLTPDSPVKNHE